jgi:hypothetical protein
VQRDVELLFATVAGRFNTCVRWSGYKEIILMLIKENI